MDNIDNKIVSDMIQRLLTIKARRPLVPSDIRKSYKFATTVKSQGCKKKLNKEKFEECLF